MHLYRTGSGGAVSIGTANNRAALTVSQTAQPTNPALSVIAHPDATDDTLQVRDATGATHVRVTAATEKTSASVVVGHGVLPAGASDGFLYIPRIDGPPTGQPTEQPGTVPIAFDATNDSLWIYSDGWRSISAS
jgi:hypothetical protein